MLRIFAISATSLAILSACQHEAGVGMVPTEGFTLNSATIAPLQPVNLCTELGGSGAPPSLTIAHSAASGVPVRVRMYDVHNDGTVTEHGVVNTQTEADGTTLVSSGFRPPCNTTNGRRNSSYRFDVAAGGQQTTVRWGDYDSANRHIVR